MNKEDNSLSYPLSDELECTDMHKTPIFARDLDYFQTLYCNKPLHCNCLDVFFWLCARMLDFFLTLLILWWIAVADIEQQWICSSRARIFWGMVVVSYALVIDLIFYIPKKMIIFVLHLTRKPQVTSSLGQSV